MCVPITKYKHDSCNRVNIVALKAVSLNSPVVG